MENKITEQNRQAAERHMEMIHAQNVESRILSRAETTLIIEKTFLAGILHERSKARRCGLCTDLKPCNMDGCPDDKPTPDRAEWEKIREEAIKPLFEFLIHCGVARVDADEIAECAQNIWNDAITKIAERLAKENERLRAIVEAFKVYGTDECSNCESGRITLWWANKKCISCDPESYQVGAPLRTYIYERDALKAQLTAAREEAKALREALAQIASCEPVIAGDCPSIAREVLALYPAKKEEKE